jgi:hypothetical protein
MFRFFTRPARCFHGSVSSGTSEKTTPKPSSAIAALRKSAGCRCLFFGVVFDVDFKPLAKRRKRTASSGKRMKLASLKQHSLLYPLEAVLLREPEGR